MNSLHDDDFDLGFDIEDESKNHLPDGCHMVLNINNRVRSVES